MNSMDLFGYPLNPRFPILARHAEMDFGFFIALAGKEKRRNPNCSGKAMDSPLWRFGKTVAEGAS
jgi:hypothetical protein